MIRMVGRSRCSTEIATLPVELQIVLLPHPLPYLVESQRSERSTTGHTLPWTTGTVHPNIQGSLPICGDLSWLNATCHLTWIDSASWAAGPISAFNWICIDGARNADLRRMAMEEASRLQIYRCNRRIYSWQSKEVTCSTAYDVRHDTACFTRQWHGWSSIWPLVRYRTPVFLGTLSADSAGLDGARA